MIVSKRKKYVILKLLKLMRGAIVKTQLRQLLFLMSVISFIFLYFTFNEKFDINFTVSFIFNRCM